MMLLREGGEERYYSGRSRCRRHFRPASLFVTRVMRAAVLSARLVGKKAQSLPQVSACSWFVRRLFPTMAMVACYCLLLHLLLRLLLPLFAVVERRKRSCEESSCSEKLGRQVRLARTLPWTVLMRATTLAQ